MQSFSVLIAQMMDALVENPVLDFYCKLRRAFTYLSAPPIL